jgi:membrane protein
LKNSIEDRDALVTETPVPASFQSRAPAHNPWKLGGLTWKELARRLWHEIGRDEILGRAAQLAYYFLLALFPALLFLTALVGLFPIESVMPELMAYLRNILPAEALSLVEKYLQQVVQGSGKDILSLGLLGALWASSSGVTAIMDSLNAVYNAKETRPMWKARLIAIAMTIGLAGFIIVSITLVLYGEHIGAWVSDWIGLGWLFTLAWVILQWPLVFTLMLFAVAVMYYVSPNVVQNWRWVTPGSLFAVLAWLLVSLGFKVYVENFGNYNAAYGSIAGVIVLMLWFYMSGIVLLIGGEINAEIEKAAGEHARAHNEPQPVQRRA